MDAAEILILGRGKLGRSLAGALAASGAATTNLSLHDPEVSATLDRAWLIVLAVPDAAIAAAAATLAERPADGVQAVVHLSGATTLDALGACAAAGYDIGSLHPLQAFAAPRPPEAFAGITIGVAGSTAELRERLDALARRLGASPLEVPDAHRALYHAAGHQAAGLLIVLAAQAQRLLAAIGWGPEEAVLALVPLLRGAVENLDVHGIPDALTGPFRRGDLDTVSGHLDALDRLGDDRIAAAYRLLGGEEIDLATALGLDAEHAARLRALIAR